MNKIICLLLVFIPISLISQENLTKDNFPKLGSGGKYSNTGPIPLAQTPEQMAGENKNWDFKNLPVFNTSEIEWFNADESSYAETFPEAELYVNDRTTGNLRFYSTTETSYNLVGQVLSGGVTVSFENPPADYIFNLEYNNPQSSEGNIDEDISVENEFIYDGYGTLELPFKTFENVIRIKVVTSSIIKSTEDTITVTDYLWLDRNGNHPLMKITRSSDPTRYIIIYKNGELDNTSVDIINDISFNLYPNPAKEYINIESDKHTLKQYEIININGELVRSGNIESNKIDIERLSKGAYLLRVKTIDKKYILRRFVK